MTENSSAEERPCRNCDAQDFYYRNISYDGILSLGTGAWMTGKGFRLKVCGSCGLSELFLHEDLLPTVKARLSKTK